MKRVITICISNFMMLGLSATALATTTPILDFNLRQGSGTTIIDSASGIVGTTHGTVWSTDPSGRPVLYFDNPIDYRFGDGDHFEIPDHDALDSPHITVESWVYPMSTGWYTLFVERILDGGSFENSITLGLHTTGYTTGTQPEFSLDRVSAGVYLGIVTSSDAITLNEWHHVVGTYDGTNVTLYVDGNYAVTASAGAPRSTGSNPLYLGHAPTGNHYFNGYYARFKMYDRALSADEVAYNFITEYEGEGTAHEWDANTVLLDHFDGSTTGSAYGPRSFTNSLLGLDESVCLPAGAYIKYPLPLWSASSGGSLDMWIKPVQYPTLIMDWNWNNVATRPPAGHILEVYVTSEGTFRYQGWGGDMSDLPVGQSIIPTNEWTHVGVTWGPGGTTLYVNGQPDGYSPVNAWPAITSSDYAYLNFWGSRDLGCVDDLRISNVERTSEEMWNYYSNALPAMITVASDHGSPNPAVGTRGYLRDATITCSVGSTVAENGTNYTCTGWTGTGSIPESGTSNSTDAITLTNSTSTITWNWIESEYWLETVVSGNGSVVPGNGWYAAGTNLEISAVPDSDWLFMYWTGDLSGGYSSSNTILLIDCEKAVTATFSDDADGDGLYNTNEWAIGTDPRDSDTDDDGFDDYCEVTEGLSPTNDNTSIVDYIRSNGSVFDLYSSNVVLDVAIGQMLLECIGGNAYLDLYLEQSDDLIIWTNAGDAVEWILPVDADKQFFRVRSQP